MGSEYEVDVMKARWIVALMCMALVMVVLAGVSGVSAGIADSPISPVETPGLLPTRAGVPTGFTPTPRVSIGTGPEPVATQEVRGTPEPAPSATPVVLLPDSGAELEGN